MYQVTAGHHDVLLGTIHTDHTLVEIRVVNVVDGSRRGSERRGGHKLRLALDSCPRTELWDIHGKHRWFALLCSCSETIA